MKVLTRVYYALRWLWFSVFPRKHPAPKPGIGWGVAAGVHNLQPLKALPPAPASWTAPRRIKWKGLGNFTLGDCVFAALAHACMAVAFYLKRFVSFTDSQVSSWYLNWTGGADVGAFPNAVLNKMAEDEWTGQSFYGFGEGGPFGLLDPTNVEQIKSGIATFGAVMLSAALQQAQETQFQKGQPWDYVAGSPVVGGHEVVAVGFNDIGPWIVSWGKGFRATWAWVTNVCNGAATGCFPPVVAAGKFVLPLVDLEQFVSELPRAQ